MYLITTSMRTGPATQVPPAERHKYIIDINPVLFYAVCDIETALKRIKLYENVYNGDRNRMGMTITLVSISELLEHHWDLNCLDDLGARNVLTLPETRDEL